jgi:hypothetical protein
MNPGRPNEITEDNLFVDSCSPYAGLKPVLSKGKGAYWALREQQRQKWQLRFIVARKLSQTIEV